MAKIGQKNYSEKLRKLKRNIDKGIKIAKKVQGLIGGNLAELPYKKTETFGETVVTILFQSPKIYPTYAEIEVYIKISMQAKALYTTDQKDKLFAAIDGLS